MGIRLFLRRLRKARRAIRAANRDRASVRPILRSGEPIRLEFGAGAHAKRPGWVTVDLDIGCDLQLDLTRPLPFPDESIAMIYASHFFEHFSYPSPMLDMLRECRRVLKPGTILSVSVPNARLYLDGYRNPGSFDIDRCSCWRPAWHYLTPIDIVNYMAYMGGHHKHLFDEENLLAVLREAGFADVRLRPLDVELDGAEKDYTSIYAEAEK